MILASWLTGNTGPVWVVILLLGAFFFMGWIGAWLVFHD